jgi:hypothetical protein
MVFCFHATHFKEVDNVEATANVVSYNRPAEMYGQPMAMPERRISLDTVKKYGVTVENGS